MTPTPKLRFIERADGFEQHDVKVTDRHGIEVCYRPKKIRTLQQWWEDKNIVLAVHITDKDGNTLPSPNRGEWRDVPLEEET
jgi:hypothetical protein